MQTNILEKDFICSLQEGGVELGGLDELLDDPDEMEKDAVLDAEDEILEDDE